VPDSSRIAQSYSASLNRVVELQIQGRVARLQRQIRESGGNPAITNRLGVLYARYGLLDRAAGVFRELAEDRGYGPAMVNMGNVSFLQSQYALALRYFTMAAETLDNDTTAQLGIARAQYELENYSEAERSFSRVARVDPELAGRFPHLGDATDAGTRASAAANKGPAIWED
jgi:tetratricopeptide (TPR) repeat protein